MNPGMLVHHPNSTESNNLLKAVMCQLKSRRHKQNLNFKIHSNNYTRDWERKKQNEIAKPLQKVFFWGVNWHAALPWWCFVQWLNPLTSKAVGQRGQCYKQYFGGNLETGTV